MRRALKPWKEQPQQERMRIGNPFITPSSYFSFVTRFLLAFGISSSYRRDHERGEKRSSDPFCPYSPEFVE
jgi:hypothetical protein